MKNNKTLIFLVLAGLGVWYYMRNKNKATKGNEELPGGRGGPGGGPIDIVRQNIVSPDLSLYSPPRPNADVKVSFSINGYKKRLGNVPNTI
jgi:hypothetical protein